MSRKAPLACRHPQASHNFFDSVRRLSPGCTPINRRIYRMSAAVIFRPRYRNSVAAISATFSSMNLFFLERKQKKP
jgi:hypothetical protein